MDTSTRLETASAMESDTDSAFSDITSSISTQSLTNSVYDYHFENGRRYHAYEAGLYMLPNDDTEQDRLDLQHHIYRITLDGRLYLAPIPKDVHHVLDIGTGTGIWAIEFADEHPSAMVLGIDLSPIQPSYVPGNCNFRVDNVESDWIPEEKYDFIHSRAMVAGIRSWPQLFCRAFEQLKPGGYIELQDFLLPVACKDSMAASTSKLVKYTSFFVEAGQRMSLDFQAPLKWHEQLQAAGFVDIHLRWFDWPMGPWAKHKKNRVIGQLAYINFYEGADVGVTFLSSVPEWSKEKVQIMVEEARNEMTEQKIHLYQRICFCYARKPEDLIID